MGIPAITTQQMMEVDRLMSEQYGIQLVQMMENAGRQLAELGRQMLGGSVSAKRIGVLCGAGNNGGGGMAAARHLHNWGAEILLKLFSPADKLKDVPASQYAILNRMGIADRGAFDLNAVDLILDAMIGYGLQGDPRGEMAEWIRRANRSTRPVLALDVPSGLDSTSGIPGNPCIQAAATLTLALPKTGLLAPGAGQFVGELHLADISVPPELYTRLGIQVPGVFQHDALIKINPR